MDGVTFDEGGILFNALAEKILILAGSDPLAVADGTDTAAAGMDCSCDCDCACACADIVRLNIVGWLIFGFMTDRCRVAASSWARVWPLAADVSRSLTSSFFF